MPNQEDDRMTKSSEFEQSNAPRAKGKYYFFPYLVIVFHPLLNPP